MNDKCIWELKTNEDKDIYFLTSCGGNIFDKQDILFREKCYCGKPIEIQEAK
jgi:hypothetical protein